jgi:hypothetical protein
MPPPIDLTTGLWFLLQFFGIFATQRDTATPMTSLCLPLSSDAEH